MAGIYNVHYLPSTSTIIARLDELRIRAVRFVNKVKKAVPDNLVLQHIGWCPLTTCYMRSSACKAYKILNNLSSPFSKNFSENKKQSYWFVKYYHTRISKKLLKNETETEGRKWKSLFVSPTISVRQNFLNQWKSFLFWSQLNLQKKKSK